MPRLKDLLARIHEGMNPQGAGIDERQAGFRKNISDIIGSFGRSAARLPESDIPEIAGAKGFGQSYVEEAGKTPYKLSDIFPNIRPEYDREIRLTPEQASAIKARFPNPKKLIGQQGDKLLFYDENNGFTTENLPSENPVTKPSAPQKPNPFKPEPKAPTGFRYKSDGSLEPIPGGPQALKNEEARKKQDAALVAQSDEAKNVIAKIDSAISKVNIASAGIGSLTKNFPNTPAMDLSADIDVINSSLGLGKLMEMKSNSKAGASGLGQLSDREMILLISALASLKQGQSPKQLKKNLLDVKRHYQNILKMNQGINPFIDEQGSSDIPKFSTAEEAEASGYKGKAMIGGRTAIIR